MASLSLRAEGNTFVPENREERILTFTADYKSGFSPIEMTVYSSGACAAFVYKKILENSKVDAAVQRVELAYEQASERPKVIESIAMTFHVSASDAHAQERAENCFKFVHKYCPVIQSLSDQIKITDRLVFE
ncbi:MAG: OsmC family protein [Aerococcus sp.]|nr:OsmC family protein [Aerococcus sp.]